LGELDQVEPLGGIGEDTGSQLHDHTTGG
jgi:hypothetical protein